MTDTKKSSKAKRGSVKKQRSAPKSVSKTSKGKQKGAVKKPAAPKKKSAQVRKPPSSIGEMASPKIARLAVAADIAPQKACLPLPTAIQLVRSCSKAPPNLPLDTQLGVLIPSQTARNSFCQCVADGVPTDRSEIPCSVSSTLQDVVDAISC